MNKLSVTSLAVRLPVAMVGLTLVALFAVVAMNYLVLRNAVESATENGLTGLRIERAAAVEEWYGGMEAVLASQAASPAVIKAMTSFNYSWGLIGDTAQVYLQRVYIDENPHPEGARDALITANDTSFYDDVHEEFHPYFRSLMRGFGFYDVFLISADGDLVYSVFKKRDFATNLLSGEWSGTGLSRAFRAAMDSPSGATAFEDFSPYGPSKGAPASFAATAIVGPQGETVGVLAIQSPVDALNATMTRATHLGETAGVILVGPDGLLRADAPGSEGGDILRTSFAHDVVRDALLGESGAALFENRDGTEVMGAYGPVRLGDVTWVVIAEQTAEEFFAPVRKSVRSDLIASLGLAVVIALLGVANAGSLSRPLAATAREMGAVAGGDYASEITQTGRRDEIGAIARAVRDARDRLEEARCARLVSEEERARAVREQTEVVSALQHGLAAMAEGDLTVTIHSEFGPDYEVLRRDFNAATTRLSAAVGEIVEKSTNVGAGASGMSRAADDLARRTESQAAALEQTVAALKQMSDGLRMSAKNADEASAATSSAAADAANSERVVGRSLIAMREIEESSAQIRQIIGVIDDIAFQTNLLALNAGVEAARAGEAGRGFAVVASEVRALAQRCAEAAREIKSLISASAAQVDSGVGLVSETGEALKGIIAMVGEIDGRVADISSGAQDQAAGVQEIMAAMDQLDEVTQRNAAMVEEMTAASRELAGDSAALGDNVAQFKVAAPGVGAVRPAPRERKPVVTGDAPSPAVAASAPRAMRAVATAAADPEDEVRWEEF